MKDKKKRPLPACLNKIYRYIFRRPKEPEGSKRKISFFDSGGTLRLAISLGDLFFIKSADNYINVWYAGGKGDIQNYMLRSSLKAVEETFKGTPLVRCHRQYIVNLEKMKVLRQTDSGYEILTDCGDIPPIPVSETYSEAVIKRVGASL